MVRLKVILSSSSSSSSSGKELHKPFDKGTGGFQRREICSLYRASNPVSLVAQPLA